MGASKPPVTPNLVFATGMLECQKTATSPCDIFSLTVVTSSKIDGVSNRVITKTTHRGKAPPKKSALDLVLGGQIRAVAYGLSWAKWLHDARGSYDFVIETIADVHPNMLHTQMATALGLAAPADPKPVTIQASYVHHEKCCHGTTTHPMLVFKPVSTTDDPNDKEHSCPPSPNDPMVCYANSFLPSSAGGGPGDKVFRWLLDFLAMLVSAGSPKSISVTAESCGARSGKGDPNEFLSALVVIHPNTKWMLKISFPGVGNWKYAKKIDHEGKKITESEALSAQRGGDFHKDTTTREKGPDATTVTVTDEHQKMSKNPLKGTGVSNTNQTQFDGKNKPVDIQEARFTKDVGVGGRDVTSGSDRLPTVDTDPLEAHEFVTVELSVNDVALHPATKIKQLLAGLRAFHDTLEKVREILNATPKVGLSFDVAVGVMNGWVAGAWGPHADPIQDDGRWYPVKKYLDIIVDIQIFTLTVSLVFGFKWLVEEDSVWKTGIEATITGSLSLTVEVKFTLTIGQKAEAVLDAKAEPSLKVDAGAYVMGAGVQANVTVGCGLECKGTLTWTPGEPPALTGEVKLLETKVTGFVMAGSSKYPMQDITLFGERTLANL